MIENFEHLLTSISEQRELMRFTTIQISKETRINKEYLDAIESNLIDKLPLGYEKIFVKSYLKYLGMDSAENLEIINSFFDVEPIQQVSIQSKNESFQIDFSQFRTLVVWIPILLVIVFLIYIVYSNFEHKKTFPIKELTVEEGLATLDTTTFEKPDTLYLNIRSLGDVYVFVKIDSIEQFSRTMKKDQEWKLKAHEQFNIYANYADRIKIDLAGKDLGAIGELNQRLNYLIVNYAGIKRKGLSQIKITGVSEE